MTLKAKPPRDRSAIGARVKARRLELEWTPGELAARLGCTTERVYSVECYGVGSLDLVETIAGALEMDPRVLAWGEVAR